jgi:hypothetical protein
VLIFAGMALVPIGVFVGAIVLVVVTLRKQLITARIQRKSAEDTSGSCPDPSIQSGANRGAQ